MRKFAVFDHERTSRTNMFIINDYPDKKGAFLICAEVFKTHGAVLCLVSKRGRQSLDRHRRFKPDLTFGLGRRVPISVFRFQAEVKTLSHTSQCRQNGDPLGGGSSHDRNGKLCGQRKVVASRLYVSRHFEFVAVFGEGLHQHSRPTGRRISENKFNLVPFIQITTQKPNSDRQVPRSWTVS